MANTDRPNGFTPSGTVNGSATTQLARKYEVAARVDATNNHGDIYIGDPVSLSTGGVVTVSNEGDTPIGVVVGVGTDTVEHGPAGMWNADNLEKRYLAHDEAGFVWVTPKENALFEIQSESDLDFTVGAVCAWNIVAATAHGNRTTGFSTAEVEAGTGLTVVKIVDSPDNDPTLANARYLVSMA